MKEPKVFAVMDKDGKLTKLVEATTVKQVKEFLLNGVTIETASALTVAYSAKSGVVVEKA